MPQKLEINFVLDDGTTRKAEITIPDGGGGGGSTEPQVPESIRGLMLPINPVAYPKSVVSLRNIPSSNNTVSVSLMEMWNFPGLQDLLRHNLASLMPTIEIDENGRFTAMLTPGFTDAMRMMQIPMAADNSVHLTYHGRLSMNLTIEGRDEGTTQSTLYKGLATNQAPDFMIDFGRVKEGQPITGLFDQMGGSSLQTASTQFFTQIPGNIADGEYPGPAAPMYNYVRADIEAPGYLYIRP